LGKNRGAAEKSRVVQVEHAKVVSSDRKVDPAATREMVRRGLQKLTGVEKPFEALFKPGERVGLKINCLGKRRIHTHRELVDAFAAELRAAGIRAQDIIVWDRFENHMIKCGYEIEPDGPGVRCYGTEDRRSDLARFDPKARYVFEGSDREPSRLSRIFTTDCDKIINLAILKDHGLAGVTLTLKNVAFGVCDNNSRFHGRDRIGPFIADFCAREDVRQKFVLHVIDGIEGCFDGGPAPSGADTIFQPRKLWFGYDPVAVDSLGAKVIEAERRAKKLPSLKADGRPPDHIALAADRGIGNDNPKRIELIEVELG
jgi:uncharacterized protein (DUF362 family)